MMNESNIQQDSDELFADLFANAPPRQRPPTDVDAEVRAKVFAEWQAVTGRRRNRNRLIGFAAAASLLLGVALTMSIIRPQAPPLQPVLVATLARALTDSGVRVTSENSSERVWKSGALLYNGALLEVPNDGGIVLDLPQGGQLRLAAGTRIELSARRQFELLAGATYFDSGSNAAHPAAHITIRAGTSTVRDIGTRFTVDLRGGALAVQVRDGEVELDRGGELFVAAGGERVTVTDSGVIERATQPTYGDSWNWVDQLAFAPQSRKIIELLDWATRETGRELVFADAQARRIALDKELVGSDQLDVAAALRAISITTNLVCEIDGAAIVLSLQEGQSY